MKTSFSNATDPPLNVSDCQTVKCLFTVGERVAIIFGFFWIFLVSLVGNCVLFFVIIRNRRLRKSSTNFSILNLSVANMLITAFFIPAFTIDVFIIDEWVFGLMGCKLIAFLQHLSINTAIVTLVVISVEKFLVVSYPFYVRSQRRKVRYLILVAWIIGVVESSVYLSYRTVQEFNGKKYCIEDWPSHKSRQVFTVIEAVVFCFIPLVFMIILHAITIKRIKARLQYRKGTNDDASTEVDMIPSSYQTLRLKKRRKAVNMLVIIVATFAVTLFPFHSYSCWRMLADPEDTTDVYAIAVGYTVVVWLLFLNSACHPAIYGLMSSEYRKAAKYSLSFRRPTASTPRTSARRQKQEQNALVLTAQGANGPST